MSAKKKSRAFAEGKVKQLRRMRQPLVLLLPASTPRNPVAIALQQRRASGAAGKHIRSRGAQRRADNVALRRALHQNLTKDNE
ncbi:hypothetical protein ABLV49_20620 [Polaromonas hydrogenivorans]|uniref:Uncharacterized protein n=1 Tax=Polaromonas hydrogenivorans TaxID=335476 RepID=A0AAU7LRK9_9BURK